MRERPILFSAPMIRAILERRKTQTRRVVKFKGCHSDCYQHAEAVNGGFGFWDTDRNENLVPREMVFSPYGSIKNRLWVRENFHLGEIVRGPNALGAVIAYAEKAASTFRPMTEDEVARCRLKPCGDVPWNQARTIPSIHMPRWASRITLEITDIRVERLQDISETDCAAEGIPAEVLNTDLGREGLTSAYRLLWESIHGPRSWDLNPYVWAITFNRITS